MQLKSIFKILGILLMIFSMAMLPPIGVSLWYGDGDTVPFLITIVITFATGLLCWLPTRTYQRDLMNRDGFLIVVMFWVVLSLFGSIPFIISHLTGVSITDAIFESVSGLTASGANVFVGLNHYTHAMLYYRQQLHFLGGMGIIVLAVAILPMLGIGGMSLYRAETPGPIKDNKLTPRLAETAKALWYIYVGLTISCAVAFHTAGLPWFEAIGESFSVVATGGFSLHDASFSHYHNYHVEIIAIFFMIFGGTNFALHYQFLRFGRISVYWKDIEFRFYIYILVIASLIVIATLWYYQVYQGFGNATLKSIFIVVSLATTTGLIDADFSKWPTFVPYMIMFLAIIGGCAASTSGGLKVMRVLLLQKQGSRELKRLIHPKAIYPIKMGDQVLSDQVMQAIWGFLGIFILMFVLLFLLLLATGLDATSAFGAVAVCLSNAGVGIGKVYGSFDGVSNFGKWILIFAMLAGRLEIFSILVILSPTFWRD